MRRWKDPLLEGSWYSHDAVQTHLLHTNTLPRVCFQPLHRLFWIVKWDQEADSSPMHRDVGLEIHRVAMLERRQSYDIDGRVYDRTPAPSLLCTVPR